VPQRRFHAAAGILQKLHRSETYAWAKQVHEARRERTDARLAYGKGAVVAVAVMFATYAGKC